MIKFRTLYDIMYLNKSVLALTSLTFSSVYLKGMREIETLDLLLQGFPQLPATKFEKQIFNQYFKIWLRLRLF